MSRRKKKERIAAVHFLPNVIMGGDEMKGKWQETIFHNTHPITLELGCGKGEYTLALARLYPKRNFIGIDKNGARLWCAATQALAEQLSNVVFLQTNIATIAAVFAPQEVSDIWITFPDPYPRPKQAKRRLTSPGFLDQYKQVLIHDGLIHLKTDDLDFFSFSRDALEQQGATLVACIPDLYHLSSIDLLLAIQTTFEKKHLAAGKIIYYLAGRFPVF